MPLSDIIPYSLYPNLSWFSGNILGNNASLEFGFKDLIQGIKKKKISIALGGILCSFCGYFPLLLPVFVLSPLQPVAIYPQIYTD